MSEKPEKPDWKKSVSRIISPVVSVRTPSGKVESRVSPWRVALLVGLAAALVGGVLYLVFSGDGAANAHDPLF